MKLSRNKMLLVSFMLFSLFFGAGNLIFPPFLGQNAGSHTPVAMLGFLATAVVLPVLGVVVVARFDGLDRLGQQVGKRFAIVFTLLIYLSIGPGLGIPRAASVPFEMAVAPYLPEGANTTVWMLVYSLAFFLVALYDTGEAGEPHRPLPDPQSAGAAGVPVRLLSVPGRGERGPVPDGL